MSLQSDASKHGWLVGTTSSAGGVLALETCTRSSACAGGHDHQLLTLRVRMIFRFERSCVRCWNTCDNIFQWLRSLGVSLPFSYPLVN